MTGTAQWYCLDCLTSFESDISVCSNLSCQAVRPLNGWERILQPDQILDRRFKVHKLLAIGGAGMTYLVRELNEQDEEDGPLLAVKVLFTGRDSGSYLHRLSNEAQILEQMAHPHIIEYRGFSHISGRSPYLVTRFALGGSLMNYFSRYNRPLSPKSVFAIGAQICSALTEAHKLGVIHRDLKPDNILLAEDNGPDGPFHALIADFGIAKIETTIHSQMTSMGTFVGTPNFAAPEQFLAQNITPSIDVYATCAMLYYALTGQYVFKFSRRLGHSKIIETLMESLPPKIPHIEATPQEMAIIEKIFHHGLQFDHQQRASLEQIYRWCMEGTELCFKNSLDSNGPNAASSLPVVEMLSAQSNAPSAGLSMNPDDPYLSDATIEKKSIHTNPSVEPKSGWSIPSPDYTVIPPSDQEDAKDLHDDRLDVDTQEVPSQAADEANPVSTASQEPINDDIQVSELLSEILQQKSHGQGPSEPQDSADHSKPTNTISDISTIDFSPEKVASILNEVESLSSVDAVEPVEPVTSVAKESTQTRTLANEASTESSKSGCLVFGGLMAAAVIGIGLWFMWPSSEPEPVTGPPGSIPAQTQDNPPTVEAPEASSTTQEVADIQQKMSDLSAGIKMRCRIDRGLVALTVLIDGSGQVVKKVAATSKGNVDVDCIYKVLKSKTFERSSTESLSVKYQAKW